jgi:hypothetical protein
LVKPTQKQLNEINKIKRSRSMSTKNPVGVQPTY